MAINSISSQQSTAVNTEAISPAEKKDLPSKPAESKSVTAPSSTVVTISTAGKAALAEATETAAQTAAEARNGDHQAQRLQAKQSAARKAA